MGATRRGAGSQSLTDKLPVVEGAVAGAAAYVVGLILIFLLLTIDSDVELGTGEAGTLDEVGWFFYSSHFANIEFSLAGESSSENLVSQASTQIPEPVFYLIPIVILIAVGYFVVSTLDIWNPSASDCAQAGATVVVGYLPLALVGVFLFTVSQGGGAAEVSTGPELLTAVLLVGLLFPLLFGSIGGVLYSQTE